MPVFVLFLYVYGWDGTHISISFIFFQPKKYISFKDCFAKSVGKLIFTRCINNSILKLLRVCTLRTWNIFFIIWIGRLNEKQMILLRHGRHAQCCECESCIVRLCHFLLLRALCFPTLCAIIFISCLITNNFLSVVFFHVEFILAITLQYCKTYKVSIAHSRSQLSIDIFVIHS